MSGIHRIELEPAYVLHTRNFRESSLIVEALARDHGRLGLVGARRQAAQIEAGAGCSSHSFRCGCHGAAGASS